jgi:hypothetical protein
MDFVLAERPIITNGGDPLGEDLIRRGIGYRADLSTITSVFEEAVKSPPTQAVYKAAAHDYSWEVITRDLADELRQASRMKNADMELSGEGRRAFVTRTKLLAKSPYLLLRALAKHGVKGTIWKAKAKLKR